MLVRCVWAYNVLNLFIKGLMPDPRVADHLKRPAKGLPKPVGGRASRRPPPAERHFSIGFWVQQRLGARLVLLARSQMITKVFKKITRWLTIHSSWDFWAQLAKIRPFTTFTGFFRIWLVANLLPLIWTGQNPTYIFKVPANFFFTIMTTGQELGYW